MEEQPYKNREIRNRNGTFKKGFGFWTGKKRNPFSKEWKDKLGTKKEKHPFYGKKRSKEVCEKIRNAQLGKKGNQYGKYGEKSANWKGGLTLLHYLIRNSFEYRQWRSDVFQRDNWTCQKCYIRGNYIEAHHINKLSEIIQKNNIKTKEQAILCEELWNINNGITLCKNCHYKITFNKNEK